MNKKNIIAIIVIAAVAVGGGIGGYLLFNRAVDNIVENAEITVDTIEVMDIDQDSMTVKVTGKITNDVSVQAAVEPFKIDVLYDGQKLGETTTGKIEINGKESPFEQTLDLSLPPSSTLNAFSSAFVATASVDISISGAATIKSGEFTVEKTIQKSLTLAGLNNGLDFSMNSFSILTASTTSFTADVVAEIVNPAQINANLQLVKFDLLWNGQKVGDLAITNLAISTGTQTKTLSCTVSNVNSALFDDIAADLLNGVDVELQLKGKAAGSVLDSFFLGLDFNVTLPGLDALDVAVIAVEFVGSTETTVTMNVDVQIYNPTSGAVMVSGLNFSVTYYGYALGIAEFPDINVLSGTHVYNVAVVFTPSNMTLLSDVITAYLNGTEITLLFTGEASGSNLIASILDGYSEEVTLPPCPATSFELLGLELVDTTATDILMNATLRITNPAPIPVLIEQLIMDANYEGVKVGNVTANGLTLNPGVNVKEVEICLSTTYGSEAKIEELLSDYIGGQTLALTMNGSVKLSLEGMLYTVNLTLNLPFNLVGLQSSLIGQVQLAFITLQYTPTPSMQATVTATIHNPFDFGIEIKQIQYDVYFNDNDGFYLLGYFNYPAQNNIFIANINRDYGVSPVSIGANANQNLQESISSTNTELCARLYDEYYNDNDLKIDLKNGQMLVKIAAFEITVSFTILQVPVPKT
jgi:LEA14-like dessication related protein